MRGEGRKGTVQGNALRRGQPPTTFSNLKRETVRRKRTNEEASDYSGEEGEVGSTVRGGDIAAIKQPIAAKKEEE